MPHLIYSYNITPQRKLGNVSPYQMMFGRLPPAITEQASQEESLWGESQSNYLNRLQHVFTYYYINATQALQLHQKNMKTHYDLHRPDFKIKVRDLVYIGPPASAIVPKMAPPYKGPFKVQWVQENPQTEELTGVTVIIPLKNGNQRKMYPRYRVKPVGEINPPIEWNPEETNN